MIDCGEINGDIADIIRTKGLFLGIPGHCLKATVNGLDVEMTVNRIYGTTNMYLETYIACDGIPKLVPKHSGNVRKWEIKDGKFILSVGLTKYAFTIKYAVPTDREYSSLDEGIFLEMFKRILASKYNESSDKKDLGRMRAYDRILSCTSKIESELEWLEDGKDTPHILFWNK